MNTKLHGRLALLVMLMIPSVSAFSQGTFPLNSLRFGIFGDYILPYSSGDIAGIPGVPCCAPTLSGRSGRGGFAIGGIAQFPIGSDFALRLGLGYSRMTTLLHASEKIGNTVERGVTVDAMVEHRIEMERGSVGLDATAVWSPFPFPLSLRLGGAGDYLLQKNYSQSETLTSPNGITFTNGRRSRNESSGPFSAGRAFQLAAVGGLSYDIAMGPSLLLSPEIVWHQGLIPGLKDDSWKVSSLRLGATLAIATEPEVGGPPHSAPTIAPRASVSARSIDQSGEESPIVQIRIEEFLSTQLRPLLNYIFFDEGSATLPARYERLSRAESSVFDPNRLRRRTMLGTYHNLLNIIGQRMQGSPSSTLRLVGCAPDGSDEIATKMLGGARAEAVAQYLQERWGIERSRLRVEARATPEKPSNPNDPDGIVENRRVELYATPSTLLDPLVINDTIRTATPPGIRFHTETASEGGIARWRLVASQNGNRIKEFAGAGSPPSTVDWNLADDQASVPTAPAAINYQLEVTDAAGATTTTEASAIAIEQVTVSKKRAARSGDHELDKYGLILFDFGSAELNDANRRLIGSVKGRIAPDAKVAITGFTDRVGDEEVNRSLAQERARATARALGTPDARVEGIGERRLLFDNELPEGRFYSRIVTVDVDNPVGR